MGTLRLKKMTSQTQGDLKEVFLLQSTKLLLIKKLKHQQESQALVMYRFKTRTTSIGHFHRIATNKQCLIS